MLINTLSKVQCLETERCTSCVKQKFSDVFINYTLFTKWLDALKVCQNVATVNLFGENVLLQTMEI